MTRFVVVVAALSLVAACTTADAPRVRPRGVPESEAFERLALQDEHGRIRPDGLMHALAQKRGMPVVSVAAGITRDSWTWLGPGNIGGRIAALWFHPTTDGLMLAGSTGGGMWKTTDGGASWAPVNDFLPSLSVTTIVSLPGDPTTIYAGTGDGWFASLSIRGAGIYKSTDGGTTWNQLSSTAAGDFLAVNSMAVSNDGSTLLAATTSQVSGSTGGIFRSTDGGATWTKTVEGANFGVVECHPSDSAKAIASTTTGQAIYSTDGGASWSVAAGFTTNNRVQVKYAPSNPSIVYASVDGTKSELWKSTDGGATYAKINSSTNWLGTQAWIHNAIWVDPTNPGTLIVGGLDLYRSTDGGVTLTKISKWQKGPQQSSHGDQKIVISPPQFNGGSNKTVYVGNDGGVYRTQDVYAVEELGGWENLDNNLGVTQFYGVAVNPKSGAIIGGAQDNGTLLFEGDAQKWVEWYGGDGGYVAADPGDPTTFYGEYTYLTIFRTLNGGKSKGEEIFGRYWSWNGSAWEEKLRANPITEAKSPTANFIAPFIIDPNNPNRLLAGARSLWATDNAKKANSEGGPDWFAIKAQGAANISAIAVAPGNSDQIWVGHNDGALYRTTNGTGETPSWTRTGDGTLPARQVLSIAVDPRDNNVAFASFAGFSANNIWKTTDGGASWTASAAGLPSIPMRSIAIHPSVPNWVYAGSDIGIFASEDGGATWKVPQDGPANVSVRQLVWMDNTLVVATAGRGAYKASIPGTSTASLAAISDEYHRHVAAAANNCYALTILIDPPLSGSVSPRPAPNCGANYTAGTVVVLHAAPATNFAFGGWLGAVFGTDPVATIPMKRDATITARFASPAHNDDPSTATDLTFDLRDKGTVSIAEDTSNASNSTDDPTTCEAGKGGKTVWFRFTPAVDGKLHIDTKGSNYDTSLTVYTGDVGSLVSTGCDDEEEGDVDEDTGEIGIEAAVLSDLDLPVRANVAYWIEVGDATPPDVIEEESSGGDPADAPEGGLLVLNAKFGSGNGRVRAVKH